jgi:excisionase family DNA binding protein
MKDERRPARNAAATSPLSASFDGSNRRGQRLEQLLTAREVGEILDFSAATIVDWAERGTLPAFKIGGRLRFRESEIGAWVETQRRVS